MEHNPEQNICLDPTRKMTSKKMEVDLKKMEDDPPQKKCKTTSKKYQPNQPKST